MESMTAQLGVVFKLLSWSRVRFMGAEFPTQPRRRHCHHSHVAQERLLEIRSQIAFSLCQRCYRRLGRHLLIYDATREIKRWETLLGDPKLYYMAFRT